MCVCVFPNPILLEHNTWWHLFDLASSKARHRCSDTPSTVPKEPLSLEKLRSESFPSCSTSTPSKLAASPESSTPNCPYTGAISKLIDSAATTSQDSGINMFFHDPEDPNRVRCTSTTTSMDVHLPTERWGFHKNTSYNCLLNTLSPRSMIRSLSSRSAVSEITIDDDYNSSSSASSRNTSQVQPAFVNSLNSPTPAQKLAATSLRLEKLAVANETANDIINRSTNGEKSISQENQWNYLPQTVWKQTAEVKQINFD